MKFITGTLIAITGLILAFIYYPPSNEKINTITPIDKAMSDINNFRNNKPNRALTTLRASNEKEKSQITIREQQIIKPHNVDEETNFSALENRYQTISKNENYPTLSSRMSAINARRSNINYSAEDLLAAIEKTSAWEEIRQPGTNLNKLSADELSDGRQFIDFDPLKVESLMVGDHLDIAIESIGQVFDMKVDSVRIFEDGNIMWKGKIANIKNGSVTITQSNVITLAAVILDDDDYTLEAHGSDGWIHNSGELFKTNINHTDEVYLD
ncbi:hypothetical protein EU508_05580 [Pseudoalteromonas fuliginea]|uniref:Uncharacterized protein n=1 Tax=Pseudoalteromonas fuliginea TaxID=1872678 RepID=A0AB73BIY2_9GAMM|nr:hypothetical protein [Pseudoalteromonas fuliginea]KAA1162467.1 hypothetical protein EU508_05580 [Pseudoalteromonas fuliginea]